VCNARGDGTRSTAAPVRGIANATAIAVGAIHACALLDDRTVWCWGGDTHAQLGDAVGPPSATPHRIAFDDVVEISSRTDIATCARTTDGAVWCWGNNVEGSIGNGQIGGNVAAPSRVIGLP
jgi:alpha-tubulin suppressor-like RCC1 family protein